MSYYKQQMKSEKPIYVTQPYLPPLEEYTEYLKKIWETKWLTNNGEFHKELENELAEYLGIEYISLFANGTIALIVALQALRITGEVITTPYSFVATAHALWWNGVTPVFADISVPGCNLDPEKIEAAITPKTTAILPVHVYGNPADVGKIEEIANAHGLKVIYDAAHAFGVKIHERSVLNFGDLSILSFHATKPFNTFEGGAIVSHNPEMKKRIDFLKNFGFKNEISVIGPGINGKMNELQAAFGLLQLKKYEGQLTKRRKIAETYREQLGNTAGVTFLEDIAGITHNYAYFPVFIEEDYPLSRDALYEKLKKHNIFGRRYFYPLITHFPVYRGISSADPENLPVAEKVARQVICLPIYSDLTLDDVMRITAVINDPEQP